jgi:hypothetical protein
MDSRVVTVVVLLHVAVQALAADDKRHSQDDHGRLRFQAGESLFQDKGVSLFSRDGHEVNRSALSLTGSGTKPHSYPGSLPAALETPSPWRTDGRLDPMLLAAAGGNPDGSFTLSYPEAPPDSTPEIKPNDRIFFKGWLLITSVEVALLCITATLPKDWTGWSSTFVADGMDNFKDAYSYPPVWDTDHWFHNYIGHPYGGSVYYNTVRCQGANKGQSFLFSTALSVQWEYLFEAVAEQPSIQDLIITPIFGSLLGEFVHRLTANLKKHGTNFGEKVIITILNPTSVVFNGYD